jgi:5-hydroxyisourate hydrolase
VALYAVTQGSELRADVTNADGRCHPAAGRRCTETGQIRAGVQRRRLFRAQGVELPEPRFIDEVTLAFGVAHADQNYHVPLVVSPWAYSTYRGS